MKIRSETRLPDCDFRHLWISEAAYYLAEGRHFEPGRGLDDWLMAEKEFSTMLIMRFKTIAEEDGSMSIKGLQRLAQSVGVENPETMMLAEEIIHAIQKATDNNACFNSEPGNRCNEMEFCLWKAECKKMIATWHPLKSK